jgi:tRNA pseudouridine55 synthase
MCSGIIVVDKPQGFTSHDVVALLRGVLKERRIGHSGTLDPMGTGVLPVFLGHATRAIEYATSEDKEYTAGFMTGYSSDTQDITGKVLKTSEKRLPKNRYAKRF